MVRHLVFGHLHLCYINRLKGCAVVALFLSTIAAVVFSLHCGEIVFIIPVASCMMDISTHVLSLFIYGPQHLKAKQVFSVVTLQGLWRFLHRV